MFRSKHIDFFELLKLIGKCLFFFNWHSSMTCGQLQLRAAMLFFFGWILRQLRLHWLSELFLFFSKQPIGQAIQTCLKRNAKVTTIGFFELLLPIATIGQFFFFSRRFGAASNITREVDDYGKEKKVFFPVDLLFRLSTNGQFFICVFFLSNRIVVWTQIQSRERKKKTMQMPKLG